MLFFFLRSRRPPRSTRTDTLFPTRRSSDLVDRDRSWSLQREALEALWSDQSDRSRAELERWRGEQGDELEGWARYCALAEVHGPRWPDWPAELQQPDSPAVAAAAEALRERVAFHAWLQLLEIGRAHV